MAHASTQNESQASAENESPMALSFATAHAVYIRTEAVQVPFYLFFYLVIRSSFFFFNADFA